MAPVALAAWRFLRQQVEALEEATGSVTVLQVGVRCRDNALLSRLRRLAAYADTSTEEGNQLFFQAVSELCQRQRALSSAV